MNALSKTLRFLGMAASLLAACTSAAVAQSPASEKIEIRWVMAGMAKDADTPRPARMAPESTLRTGDRIKMYLKVSHKCFFYLFYQDPEGRMQLIYPDSLPPAALAGGTRLTVPGGEQWFELDAQTGKETFHVLVSPTPLHAIETLYENYRQSAPESAGPAAARIIAAIERLRQQQRPLTTDAERPLSIGGTFRGAHDKQPATTINLLDHLAEDISTTSVFCRTYTIEHH